MLLIFGVDSALELGQSLAVLDSSHEVILIDDILNGIIRLVLLLLIEYFTKVLRNAIIVILHLQAPLVHPEHRVEVVVVVHVDWEEGNRLLVVKGVPPLLAMNLIADFDVDLVVDMSSDDCGVWANLKVLDPGLFVAVQLLNVVPLTLLLEHILLILRLLLALTLLLRRILESDFRLVTTQGRRLLLLAKGRTNEFDEAGVEWTVLPIVNGGHILISPSLKAEQLVSFIV